MPEAEQALADYIASKWEAPQLASDSRRDPSQVLVADVLALYAMERAPKLADPVSNAGWIKHLLTWWDARCLTDVRRSTCQAYVAHRTSQDTAGAAKRVVKVSDQTARRELEVLSAAIGYWHGEDTLTTRPVVWLPEKPQSPRDALTRSQAAALLWAAMGHRKGEDGRWGRLDNDSGPSNRAHLRRFLLIGFYTGTRSKVITQLLWEIATHRAWVDLDAGMIYRRGKAEKDHATKRRPVVKIPPRLLVHMRRWRRLDAEREARMHNRDPQFRLISVIHHGGQPIGEKVNKGFDACVADAGLPPEVTPHWLRHSAATWLMEAGEEMWKAAGFLGMTTKTLEDHYGHHRPDYQASAAKAAGGRR